MVCVRDGCRQGAEPGGATAASAEAEIKLAMSSEAALSRIIERDGVPIGYAHAVEIGLWARAPPDGCRRAPGTSTISWRRRRATATEARQRRAGAADARRCSPPRWRWPAAAVVSIRNEAAARAYERAGFRWLRIWQDPLLGPSWLMLKERPEPPPAR